MKEKWIDHSKKEIYFLEWLAQASGFTEEQILKNMKPENQKWSYGLNDSRTYLNVDQFIKEKKAIEYMNYLFKWNKSILFAKYRFWQDIDNNWIDLIENKDYLGYEIKFSNLRINSEIFKIEKEKIKIKNRKIKI
jgi:hypothetical protein